MCECRDKVLAASPACAPPRELRSWGGGPQGALPIGTPPALAPNIAVMITARVVLGLAVGGASSTVPVYLAEIAPKQMRGRLVAGDALVIVTGQLLAFSTNAVLANVWDGHSTWRVMLILASLPAIGLWVGMHFMPETARWYACKRRFNEAAHVLRRTRSEDYDIKVS